MSKKGTWRKGVAGVMAALMTFLSVGNLSPQKAEAAVILQRFMMM